MWGPAFLVHAKEKTWKLSLTAGRAAKLTILSAGAKKDTNGTLSIGNVPSPVQTITQLQIIHLHCIPAAVVMQAILGTD